MSEPSKVDRPVHGLVDHLFRRSAARMVAALTRTLGPEHLDVAEDVVQEALLKALNRWPHQGVPANPEGWLFTVARNLARDRVRRHASLAHKLPLLSADLPEAGSLTEPALDDELAMIFMCCHPILPAEAQVALTLKTVGGFSVEEIAAGFLSKPATIAQRLVRAKRLLASHRIQLEIPVEEALGSRLESVLAAIYLLFTEGYGSKGGTEIRPDLIGEALRLVEHLMQGRATARPEVYALGALLSFQASRVPARLQQGAAPLLLTEQDRSLWDRRLIVRGFTYLEHAAAGDSVTAYHLEAGIAAAHAAAASVDETDWRGVLDLYNQLLEIRPSPVVILNRAVATARVRGPEAALAELDEIGDDDPLAGYPLLPAMRGYLLTQLHRTDEALQAYRDAYSRAGTDAERTWFERAAGRPLTLRERV